MHNQARENLNFIAAEHNLRIYWDSKMGSLGEEDVK